VAPLLVRKVSVLFLILAATGSSDPAIRTRALPFHGTITEQAFPALLVMAA